MLQDQSNQNDKMESAINQVHEQGKLDPIFISPVAVDPGNETVVESSAMSEFTNSWAFQFTAGVTTGLLVVALIVTIFLTLFPA